MKRRIVSEFDNGKFKTIVNGSIEILGIKIVTKEQTIEGDLNELVNKIHEIVKADPDTQISQAVGIFCNMLGLNSKSNDNISDIICKIKEQI